jgi:hypothetical protein
VERYNLKYNETSRRKDESEWDRIIFEEIMGEIL